MNIKAFSGAFARYRHDTIDTPILWRLLRESLLAQNKLYLTAVAAMIMIAATTAATAWIMERIVDAMTASENRTTVFLVAAAVAAIFTAKGIATYIQVVSLTRAGNRIVAVQQDKLYTKLLRHGVAFFNVRESSDLLLRITHGAQAARNVVALIVTSAVRDVLTLIGLVMVMVYQQPVLSMVSLVVGPLAIFGVRLLLKQVRSIMAKNMLSLAEIIRVVQETSAGIRVIKVFALEERMFERMRNAIGQVEQRSNAIARLEAVTSPLMETLAGFAIAAVIALSAMNVLGGEPPTAGQLMSFITALLLAYEPAKRLSKVRVSIEAGMVGVRMMFELLDLPETLEEAQDATDLLPGPGKVELRGVRFGYNDDRQVIDGIDIVFEARTTTALVGPSGGGKSTLLNLVMRLYDPTAGTVLIDGQDIRRATFRSLRRKISFVGQDTFLFANTVMENIRFGRPGATDEEVYEAARIAHAHEFIEDLPQGYATPVGENGAFLSGGQRQRLSIARAVLRKCDILLLDEATSALDATSEALIKSALARIAKDTTIIVIAHRLSTILQADRICVIANGRIHESGTTDELLAARGMFHSFFEEQYPRHLPGGTDLLDRPMSAMST